MDSHLAVPIVHIVLQIAILIITSWIAKTLARKCKLPEVIGYIIIGILIGPFLLGTIPIFSLFKEGIFPFTEGSIPISPHLFALSVFASILLLFSSGLETDMQLFIKYAYKGSIVGTSGLIVSFIGGYLISMLFNSSLPPFHATHLIIATITTASSVGISTAILSTNNKINSPEGVTILSAAVFDDVLGMILLAIIISLTNTLSVHSTPPSSMLIHITLLIVKSIGIWLFCTVLGILFSRTFGKSLKKIFRNPITITLISLGCALLLGSIFELLGLSLVIGAYIVGLTLSNTDISYLIQEKIHPIAALLIPIFFIITGMRINLQEMLQVSTLLMGLLLGIVCMLTKIIGSGVPALLLGFNPLGALRIGLGMAPRGEIPLIIAGIGITTGIITDTMFAVILIMISITAITSPILLNILLSIEQKGTSQDITDATIKIPFNFKTENLKRTILLDLITLLEDEYFFINKIEKNKHLIYHIRKDNVFISLNTTKDSSSLIFHTEPNNIAFIKTTLYEAITNILESAQDIKHSLDKGATQSTLIPQEEKVPASNISLSPFMKSSLVTLEIQNTEKEEIIRELCDLLDQDDLLYNANEFIQAVLERESSFSTGMQYGIAIPHAKSKSVKKLSVVVGLKKSGVNFDSLDGLPSNIFILIASPLDTPHLELLTTITTLVNNQNFRNKILSCTKRQEIISLFCNNNHNE